jgi:nucleoside-diphosphate-sugar epimerase
MTQSFTASEPLAQGDEKRRRVLVTGAAGRIGSYFVHNSHHLYDLRLMVRGDEEGISDLKDYGEVVEGELADLECLKNFCIGVDTVLHLAADPSPGATWPSILNNNIIGTYNACVAAKAAGCRRLIYASSIHAVSGYPADVQVKTSEPVNPGDLYGVSKCFGEAMGRYMAGQEGLSVIAIRIGAFQGPESARKKEGVAMLDAWVSERDLNQLFNRCIATENIQFAILHGLSDNRFKRMDISDARELVGYAPQDDLTEENPRLKELHLNDVVPAHNQAGSRETSGLRDSL